jgi:GrpB-like predicted nucleotidyltransferase (UPF0157 family)
MTNIKQIILDSYNPSWSEQYTKEAKLIEETLGVICTSVNHVGSTSVRGMLAKPILDIIVEVLDTRPLITQIEGIGCQYKGEYNIPYKFLFTKRSGVNVNLHIYPKDHAEVELNIKFRDYLQYNKLAREKYAELKKTLLQNDKSHKKENSIFSGYTLGKDKFIRKALKETGYNRLRLLKCTHEYEHEAVRDLLKANYQGDKILNINNPNMHHLIYCRGTEVIAYTAISFGDNTQANITSFALKIYYAGADIDDEFASEVMEWASFKVGLDYELFTLNRDV